MCSMHGSDGMFNEGDKMSQEGIQCNLFILNKLQDLTLNFIVPMLYL